MGTAQKSRWALGLLQDLEVGGKALVHAQAHTLLLGIAGGHSGREKQEGRV